MFPAFALVATVSGGFPRIRGDVPRREYLLHGVDTFSPHTRGCSDHWGRTDAVARVFPAYAGMFRGTLIRMVPILSFPRIRGDVPGKSLGISLICLFSPHTRGCSAALGVSALAMKVFPAYAGMFPGVTVRVLSVRCFPRIRGDVPSHWLRPSPTRLFSPHTRGCSPTFYQIEILERVFPAYAGMFLVSLVVWLGLTCFPRIRGDVP